MKGYCLPLTKLLQPKTSNIIFIFMALLLGACQSESVDNQQIDAIQSTQTEWITITPPNIFPDINDSKMLVWGRSANYILTPINDVFLAFPANMKPLSFSPSGAFMLIVDRGSKKLYLANSDGTDISEILDYSEHYGISRAWWKTDRELLIVFWITDYNPQIYHLRIATSELSVLSPPRHYILEVDPYGQYWIQGSGGTPDIDKKVEIAGIDVDPYEFVFDRNISPFFEGVLSSRFEHNMDFIPSSNLLVFLGCHTGDIDCNIYRAEVNRFHIQNPVLLHELSEDVYYIESLTTSPNGEYVAFISVEREKKWLKIIRTSTGEQIAAWPFEQYDLVSLHWSPDSSRIAYVDTSSDHWVIAIQNIFSGDREYTLSISGDIFGLIDWR